MLSLLLLVLVADPSRFGTYEKAVQTHLKVPPLEAEARNADAVVRALVLPSFDPECAVSIVLQGERGRLTVRCAAVSVWYSQESLRERGQAPLPLPLPTMAAFELTQAERVEVEGILGAAMALVVSDRDVGKDGLTTWFEFVRGKEAPRMLEVWHHGGAPDQWLGAIARMILARPGSTTPAVTRWAKSLKGR